jgi:hypothetical protein
MRHKISWFSAQLGQFIEIILKSVIIELMKSLKNDSQNKFPEIFSYGQPNLCPNQISWKLRPTIKFLQELNHQKKSFSLARAWPIKFSPLDRSNLTWLAQLNLQRKTWWPASTPVRGPLDLCHSSKLDGRPCLSLEQNQWHPAGSKP